MAVNGSIEYYFICNKRRGKRGIGFEDILGIDTRKERHKERIHKNIDTLEISETTRVKGLFQKI